eukprot:TRINITY_DN1379_c0_g3_i1.p1 TRINITY_DN1379_c0_g3~~TRINITY_DN1379_c0_g3_i1.p1  ORF type:complete len:104 (-),score=1.17 TRINITY_DN1379_c0_g3_i1:37-348(-)
MCRVGEQFEDNVEQQHRATQEHMSRPPPSTRRVPPKSTDTAKPMISKPPKPIEPEPIIDEPIEHRMCEIAAPEMPEPVFMCSIAAPMPQFQEHNQEEIRRGVK